MLAVETKGLTKQFSHIRAVSNLSLHIEHGSVYGFLGPNGAGKTTTMRMLVGLARSSSGTMHIYGNQAGFYQKSFRREVGFLPDDPIFYEWMTAPEYLSFMAALLGLSKHDAKAQAHALLKKTELEGVTRRIGTFSRGMKKRLGIAQALLGNPKLIILDEPTAALDPLGREELFALIDEIRKTTTVMLSTHILDDVERVCDSVGIINKGVLLVEDKLEHLRQQLAVRAVRVEVDDPENKLTAWLASQPDFRIAKQDQQCIEVHVRDLASAQKAIPEKVAQFELPLRKFEIIVPDLEQVFVQLVTGEQHDTRSH